MPRMVGTTGQQHLSHSEPFTGPTLDMDLTGEIFPPELTFTRASAGSRFDSTGNRQDIASNLPRIDYDPTSKAKTNMLRNSTMVGAVVGNPGTIPTNWIEAFVDLTSQIVGIGTESGLPYIDYRIYGTPVSTSNRNIRFEQFNQVAATIGQTWTVSAYFKLTAGSLNNVSIYFRNVEFNTVPQNVGSTDIFPVPTGAALNTQRFTITRLNTGSTTSCINPTLIFLYTAGQPVDFTLRIGAPQAEMSPTVGSFIATSGVAVGGSNFIRNSTMQGASAAIASVLPTNWSLLRNDGLSSYVVGTGIEGGIPYIDLRYFGTSVGGQSDLSFDSPLGIPAVNGQVFTQTFYVRVVGGGLTNVVTVQFRQIEWLADGATASGAYVGNAFVPTGAALATQRKTYVRTISGTTTAFILPQIQVVSAAGPVDITLRIAGTQLELNSSATTFTPTYGTSGIQANYVRNNTMVGAVIGTPGTDPTNWNLSSNLTAGLTKQIVGIGTSGGLPYIDVRYYGTVATAGNYYPSFDTGSWVATDVGTYWTNSIYLALVGGSLTNVNALYFVTNWDYSNNSIDLRGVLTSTLTRYTSTNVTNALVTITGYPFFNIGLTAGVIDFTLRIAAPQMERTSAMGPVVLTGYPNVSGTNFIRNSNLIGANAGLPGTNANLWPYVVAGLGLSYLVVGTGTESGLPYIDYRLYGTVSGTGPAFQLSFDSATAATGQTWTISQYLRLMAGSMNGVASIQSGIVEYTSGNAFVAGQFVTGATPTNAGLITQRNVFTRTLSGGATVGNVYFALNFNVTSGQLIDITLRIGAPQLEQAASASAFEATSTAVGTFNKIRNSTMSGAVAGSFGNLAGSHFFAPPTYGLSYLVVATGISSGIPYMDIRAFGTVTGDASNNYYETGTFGAISAVVGQTWTHSVYLQLVSQLTGSPIDMYIFWWEMNSAKLGIRTNYTAGSFTPDAVLRRYSMTATNSSIATSSILPRIRFNILAGATVDFTMRIGGQQVEQDVVPNSWISTGNSPVGTRNFIRNSTMQGAVAQATATQPSGGWSIQTPTGNLTSSAVVGVGYENGIPYIDISYVTSGAISFDNFIDNLSTPALVGQVWTGSYYVRLIAGSNTSVTHNVRVFELGGTAGSSNTIFVPTAAALATQRIFSTYAAVSLNTTSAQLRYCPVTSGAAAWTIRIGGPQLEQGLSATAFIPTYGNARGSATPRGLLIEEQRTNSIRNPRCEGAVVAGIGTPPTNWQISAGSGITSSIIGTGTEAGFNYIDVLVAGTSTGAATFTAYPEPSGVAAANGQAWTYSLYTRLVGGSLTNLTGGAIYSSILDSGNAALGASTPVGCTPTSAALSTQRIASTVTITQATATKLQPILVFYFTAGVTVNTVLRIAAPQLEQAAAASTYTATSGAAVAPNFIRNSTMVGAVVSTGTLPTYFQKDVSSAQIYTIVGSGYESGIPYFDIRINTGIANNDRVYFAIFPEQTNGIPASPSQTWVFSMSTRIVAGSLGSSLTQLVMRQINSSSIILTDAIGSSVPLTSAPLTSQRISVTVSSTVAATAFVLPFLQVYGLSTTAPLDVTLRIAAPQLELGAFATSIILPTIGTPAVATRAQDLSYYTNAPTLNLNEGSLVAHITSLYTVPTYNNEYLAVGLPGNSDMIRLVNFAGGTGAGAQAFSTGTNGGSLISANGFTVNVPFKAGITYMRSTLTISAILNGSGLISGTVTVMPASLTQLSIGGGNSRGGALNGWIRRVRYWPRALPLAEMQTVTT